MWSQAQKDFCCASMGRGCATTAMPPTLPPTLPPFVPPTAPPGPVDPFNCAVGQYPMWAQDKQSWCCRIHHICGQPTQPPAPADPYNCADGSQTGRRAGRSPRKNGAVEFMAKAARTKVAVAPRRLPWLNHTTATRELPIGGRAGLLRRRPGAVRTKARDALQQLEDVPEHELIGPS